MIRNYGSGDGSTVRTAMWSYTVFMNCATSKLALGLSGTLNCVWQQLQNTKYLQDFASTGKQASQKKLVQTGSLVQRKEEKSESRIETVPRWGRWLHMLHCCIRGSYCRRWKVCRKVMVHEQLPGQWKSGLYFDTVHCSIQAALCSIVVSLASCRHFCICPPHLHLLFLLLPLFFSLILLILPLFLLPTSPHNSDQNVHFKLLLSPFFAWFVYLRSLFHTNVCTRSRSLSFQCIMQLVTEFRLK